MAKIHFLNVVEGDCSIIQHDNGHVTMIDICCGNLDASGVTRQMLSLSESLKGINGDFKQKAYPTNPVVYLKEHGINCLFRYIQTHPDMDHMDGLKNLAENVSILNFWDTDHNKVQIFDENGKSGRYLKVDWDCYSVLRRSNSNPKSLFYYDGTSNKYYAEDDNGLLKDDFIKILSPTPALVSAANDAKDWNDCSYVILYCIQGRKLLFCGDADMNTISHLIEKHVDDISDLDILIAPHHGRDSDKDFSFLDIMKPKLTLIGNAKSEHLAYSEWNKRHLNHITNNQGGNILLDVRDGAINVCCSNRSFANAYNQHYFGHNSFECLNNLGYWALCRY